MVTNSYICQHIGSSLLAFKWCIHIWSWPIEYKGKNQGHPNIDCEYLVNGDRTNIEIELPTHRKSRLLAFEWCNYIWPWTILKVKVKVMQILTMNISETVTNR